MGSYLTGVTYNGIGQLTGTSLGNGVTESYGYDANRMQLITQTATKSGEPTGGLMNLTYAYNASAGQMGAGTSTGNAGQLMNVSGTIGGTFESGPTAMTTSDGWSLPRRLLAGQPHREVSAMTAGEIDLAFRTQQAAAVRFRQSPCNNQEERPPITFKESIHLTMVFR